MSSNNNEQAVGSSATTNTSAELPSRGLTQAQLESRARENEDNRTEQPRIDGLIRGLVRMPNVPPEVQRMRAELSERTGVALHATISGVSNGYANIAVDNSSSEKVAADGHRKFDDLEDARLQITPGKEALEVNGKRYSFDLPKDVEATMLRLASHGHQGVSAAREQLGNMMKSVVANVVANSTAVER